MHPVTWLRILLLNLLLVSGLPAEGETEPALDERLLREQNIGLDGPSLVRFLQLRSPTGDERKQILQLLAALGSDSFDEREAATQNLIQRGSSVLEDLRKLLDNPDAEVRRRAVSAIQEIEGGPGSILLSAVIRQVVRQAPAEAVTVLLRFLPFAQDEALEDEIILALESLHRNKPLSQPVLAALTHPTAIVRGTAGRVVGKIGTPEQRAQAAGLLRDSVPNVRFQVAQGFIGGGQRDAVAVVIDLLTEESPLCWQAEEVLFRLAGEKGPSETTSLTGDEERKKSHEIWQGWWRENASRVDLARLNSARQLGLTLGIEYNTGRVWEAGPDRTLRFEIKGLQGPMEAQILPGGRILIAESNGHQVTERDLRGNVLWTITVQGNEPTGCQRLVNGNTFVSSYSRVMEYNREGKSLYEFNLPHGSNAIRKHRNGNIIFATESHIIEVDTTGREVRKIAIPRESMWVGIRDLPGDRFLMANSSSGRVIEIDRTGKVLWETRVAGACGIERTSSGHTLVATSGKVVELDRAGNTVWEMKTPGYVRRVHRR